MKDENPLGGVVFYQREDGAPALEVQLDAETVWLSQQQIAELFGASRTNIVEHIKHVYEEGELEETATCRKFRQVRTEGARQVAREIPFYNLDVIISVGYRVKSKVATQFRIWATNQLRDYLVRGYAVNQQRLTQLGSIVQILSRSTDELVAGVADVLTRYLPGLTMLRDYDGGQIESAPGAVPDWELTLDEARGVIQRVASEFPSDGLLGLERGEGLAGIIATIYQSFGGEALYATVEEQAANLLYLVIKDHPLSDGNKRSAAALFVTFLARNGILDDDRGTPRISNNALAALTLMVAMSDPAEKGTLVALVVRMITDAA